MTKSYSINLQDIHEARDRICEYVHCTPIVTCESLDALTGAHVLLKCENLQKVGAFKARGALNAVFQLSEEQLAAGVITHSSGNHGAALARAAAVRNCRATIIMPEGANQVKVAAIQNYGGEVVFYEKGDKARAAMTEKVRQEKGGVYIPPFEHEHIIAGQGTAGLELLEQIDNLDTIIAPIGGGGLIAGILIAVKAIAPHVKIIGAEPALAQDAYQSWKAGHLVPHGGTTTIADGLRTNIGELNFQIVKELIDDIVIVSEDEIIEAMRLLWTRAKQVVEPSGSLPLAALCQDASKHVGKNVALVLSGGNIDPGSLPF